MLFHDDYFYGNKIEFWLELKDRFDKLNGNDLLTAESLLNEVLELRKKLNFYESRIEQMHKVMVKDAPH